MQGHSKLRKPLTLPPDWHRRKGRHWPVPPKPAPQEDLSNTIVTELLRKEKAKRDGSALPSVGRAGLTTRLVSRGAKGPALMSH